VPDGSCGPQTMHALRRLGRKVTGGAPLALREITKLHGSGRALVGKTIVIDPGHGGPDLGAKVPEGLLRWYEAELALSLSQRPDGLVQREIVMRTGLANCQTHAKTWELLRLTRMPAVRVEVGYLTSPDDRAKLVDPQFRDRVVEAVMAAVQRMYFPVEDDVPT